MKALNIKQVSETLEIKELDFIIDGLVRGTVGFITSPKATGKSFFLLNLIFSLSLGRDLMNSFGINKVRKVGALFGEDSIEKINNMVIEITKSYKLQKNSKIDDALIFSSIGNKFNPLIETDYKVLFDFCNGKDIVFFDTFSKFHNSNENSKSEMIEVLSKYENIAIDTGCSIVFTHNNEQVSNHNELNDGVLNVINHSKWILALDILTKKEAFKRKNWAEVEKKQPEILDEIGNIEKFLTVEFTKLSYTKPKETIWLKHDANGVFNIKTTKKDY